MGGHRQGESPSDWGGVGYTPMVTDARPSREGCRPRLKALKYPRTTKGARIILHSLRVLTARRSRAGAVPMSGSPGDVLGLVSYSVRNPQARSSLYAKDLEILSCSLTSDSCPISSAKRTGMGSNGTLPLNRQSRDIRFASHSSFAAVRSPPPSPA